MGSWNRTHSIANPQMNLNYKRKRRYQVPYRTVWFELIYLLIHAKSLYCSLTYSTKTTPELNNVFQGTVSRNRKCIFFPVLMDTNLQADKSLRILELSQTLFCLRKRTYLLSGEIDLDESVIVLIDKISCNLRARRISSKSIHPRGCDNLRTI